MPPKRKKAKTANDTQDEQNTEANSSDLTIPKDGQDTTVTDDTAAQLPAPQNIDPGHSSPAPNRSSWSWRPKATPITQIARESVSVAQGSTSGSSESQRTPSSVSKSLRGSRKSIPLAAEATKVHATSDKSRPSLSHDDESRSAGERKLEERKLEERKTSALPDAAVESAPSDITEKNVEARGSWFGWWSRPDGYASDVDGRKAKKQKLDESEAVVDAKLLSENAATDSEVEISKNALDFEGIGNANTPKQANQTSTRSWFGLWSSVQNEQAASHHKNEQQIEQPDITVSPVPANVENAMNTAEPTELEKDPPTELHSKPSGWAFWSSAPSKTSRPASVSSQKQIGELAVADTPSQMKPEAAQFNEQRFGAKSTEQRDNKRSNSLLRPRPRSVENAKDAFANAPAASNPSEPPLGVSQVPTPSGSPPPPTESELPKISKGKQQQPNLILPAFKEVYPNAPSQGYVERLTQYLARSLSIPGTQTQSAPQHVFVSSSPPRIKKAVALGIHGYFPGALIQRVIGQPTGTSIRFANYASASIQKWCAEHQPEVRNVEIEKVALEGDGYIADRVATLWKLLLNWLSHLRSADFILVACHSQGVPVAVMLIAKLIQLGALPQSSRIGICAMAGINLGPFMEYRSRLFGGTALELFEFCDHESAVSKSYAEGLDICLRNGVRITFVGSIDDQLVSLESALHAPLSHPYVSRAVFIDGRLHATSFLTHLVVFALKLRNRGVSDHGLIRELSAPLAGSLVGGEGHSRIYDDPAVYRLATEFALESTGIQLSSYPAIQSGTNQTGSLKSGNRHSSESTSSNIAAIITPYEPPPSNGNINPFQLPWSVRGMLEEDLVKKEMQEELETLVKEFEDWKPTSKVLKDVRFRLEGVRNMH